MKSLSAYLAASLFLTGFLFSGMSLAKGGNSSKAKSTKRAAAKPSKTAPKKTHTGASGTAGVASRSNPKNVSDVIERFSMMDKNCTLPCTGCDHLDEHEQKAFAKLSKSDEELNRYVCAFRKFGSDGEGQRNFAMALPAMKQAALSMGIPVAYMACIPHNEGKWEDFGAGQYRGMGHFDARTARTVVEDVRRFARLNGYGNVSRKRALELMRQTKLTPENAPFQAAAIAANARRLINLFGLKRIQAQKLKAETSDPGETMLNTLLMVAYAHNVGQSAIRKVPMSAFTTNSMEWIKNVTDIPGDYIKDLKSCMERGNFSPRVGGAGTHHPNFARCGK